MEEEQEYEYYEVEVTKKAYASVYIRVPKGVEITFRDSRVISAATIETVGDYDWDDYGWEGDLETGGIWKVSEDKVGGYDVYDATKDFPKPEDPNQLTLDIDKN
jgi:hypothetical protein